MSKAPVVLRCPRGHPIKENVKKLKPWQGHVHEHKCGCCGRSIDRKEERWTCGQDCKCEYEICNPCWDAHLKKEIQDVIDSEAAAAQQLSRVPVSNDAGARPVSAGPGTRSFASNDAGVRPASAGPGTRSSIASARPASQLQEPLLGSDAENGHGNAMGRPPVDASKNLQVQTAPSRGLSLRTKTACWVVLWFIASSSMVWTQNRILLAKDLNGNPFACPWLVLCLADAGAAGLFFVVKFSMQRLGKMTIEGMPNVREPFEGMPGVATEAEKQKSGQLIPMAILAVLHGLQVGLGGLTQSGLTLPLCLDLQMLTPAVALTLMVKLGAETPNYVLLGIVACGTLGGFCAVGFSGMSVSNPEMFLFGLLDRVVAVAKWSFALIFMISDMSPSPMYLAMSTLGAAAVIGMEVNCVFQFGCLWEPFNLARPGHVYSLLALLSCCNAVQLIAEFNSLRLTSVLLLAFLYPLKSACIGFDLVGLVTRELPSIAVVQWVGIALCVVAGGAYAKVRSLPEAVEVVTMEECVKTIIVPGDGKTRPQPGDVVTTKYTLYLEDGRFIQEGSFQFSLGSGEIIKGWDVGASKMTLGEKAVLHIPARYAYGVNGLQIPPRSGNYLVPPESPLTFKVRLMAVGEQEAPRWDASMVQAGMENIVAGFRGNASQH